MSQNTKSKTFTVALSMVICLFFLWAISNSLLSSVVKKMMTLFDIDQARAEFADRVEELEAYKLDRDITSGEAHISTAVENGIQVAEDGVTATWQYANSDLSGNAAILTLVLDGETIYTSEALKPGETVETLTLDKALASGEYQAMAVTTVYDAAGEAQLTSRVPVTINVR